MSREIKKILITGGVGFVGTNLINHLLNKGDYIIHSLDDYSIGSKSNEIDGCHYHSGDIENVSLMDKDFDLIYHLAGLSRIQPSFDNPSETFRVNSIGTEKVCEFTKKINAKMVYAGSSSSWYNSYQSPYACYKHLGEQICKMYKLNYGTDIEIARLYNVYGPKEITTGQWAAVIGTWRDKIKNNQLIKIVGDGEQRRDFTHIDDVVDGLYKIGFSDKKHQDAWELGTGKNYTLNEVYQMFNKRFGIGCEHIPQQRGNYPETLRRNDDAVIQLNWNPSDRLKDYIETLN